MSGAPPAPPRFVVFDLDGTLVHSAPDIHAAAAEALRGLGRREVSLDEVMGFIGNGVPKLVERCLAATGGRGEDFDAALASFEAAYARAPHALTRPFADVEPVLDRLAAAGIALAICTNKEAGLMRAVLDGLGLAGRFPVALGAGDAPALKPDPRMLDLCLDRLGAAPDETVFIGDSETDEAAAQASGVRFGFYTGGYRNKAPEAFDAAFAFDAFGDLPARLGLAAA